MRLLALLMVLSFASSALAQAHGDVIGPGARHMRLRGERIEACERARQEIGDPHTPVARLAQLREYITTQCRTR